MTSSATEPSDAEIVARVRERSGFTAEAGGPSDARIAQGVRGFAREFDYWYNRVLHRALPKYQSLIIDRINPMIRGMQLEGLTAQEVAERLLHDYAHRNYVTAGGWALEQLAISTSARLRKSSATGIDAEWHESGPHPVVHLYVIKSSTVTRNSDILKALKTHGHEAQNRLMQTDKRAVVRVYYIVTAGQRSSTYHDGVHRPSSAEFWAQTFDLEGEESLAVDLVLAMAQEAGVLLKGLVDDSSLRALVVAVAAFISEDDDPETVDWEFLAQRNMLASAEIKSQNRNRHERAKRALSDAGYEWPSRSGKDTKDSATAEALAEAAADLSPEMQIELGEILPPHSSDEPM